MEGLRFVPLAIWAVAIPFAIAYEQHCQQIDGRKDQVAETGKTGARLWLVGIVFFLIIGVFE